MRAKRLARRRTSAVAMVEFALVGPLFFLVVLGVFIAAIIVKNEITLSNITRDSARAAAICGSQTSSGTSSTLPNGTPCTPSNLQSYIDSNLSSVDSSLAGTESFKLCNAPKTTCSGPTNIASGGLSLVSQCVTGYDKSWTIEVSVSYQQPLYVPLVGYLLGNGTTNTRTIDASGEAACEQ